MKQHISFDIETLGNSPSAPLVQIGAVKFNVTSDGEPDIVDRFLATVDIKSLDRYGLVIEPGTLDWWFSQEHEAIKSVFTGDGRVNLRVALRSFYDWVGKHGDYLYWSHATFDPPILNHNTLAVGLQRYIPFRAFRDLRTLTEFVGKIEVERVGIHHNGLDDAIFQAKYIAKGLHIIENWKK